jgi:hypothetical protein
MKKIIFHDSGTGIIQKPVINIPVPDEIAALVVA